MAGLGDLLGKAARNTVTGGKGGMVREFVAAAVGDEIADKANSILEKAGIQKQLDGKILIKLPYMKSVEERTEKVLSLHPDWNKIFTHLYDDSVKYDTVFHDNEGNEVYKIRKSRRNLKHIELIQGDTVIGSVSKKLTVLKNPLSLADPYKYTISLHGYEIGQIIVKDQKLIRSNIEPDFDTWVMKETSISNFTVFNSSGVEVAAIHYVGEHNYIFDYSDSFNPELLILCYMTTRMRDEEKSSKR